jgi:uncharacterized membrane protein
MVVGAIWYAKPVFGRRWMRLSGLTDDDMKTGAALPLIITFVVSFFTAAVLAGSAAIAQHFYDGTSFLVTSVLTAVILWIGFTAARMITHDLFDRRSSSLTVLNLAHELVTVVVMGLIIGAFGFPG